MKVGEGGGAEKKPSETKGICIAKWRRGGGGSWERGRDKGGETC